MKSGASRPVCASVVEHPGASRGGPACLCREYSPPNRIEEELIEANQVVAGIRALPHEHRDYHRFEGRVCGISRYPTWDPFD
jgi:hypothetical protein